MRRRFLKFHQSKIGITHPYIIHEDFFLCWTSHKLFVPTNKSFEFVYLPYKKSF